MNFHTHNKRAVIESLYESTLLSTEENMCESENPCISIYAHRPLRDKVMGHTKFHRNNTNQAPAHVMNNNAMSKKQTQNKETHAASD